MRHDKTGNRSQYFFAMTNDMRLATPIIIQGAKVLLPSGEIVPRAVAIADGKITAVGIGLEVTADTRIIDGTGLTLLPGVIDPHVHFCEPGLEHLDHQGSHEEEDLFTESRACARGGVTSFLEMPNTLPSTVMPTATQDATQDILTDKLAIAASKSLVNYGFFVGVTAANLDDLSTANPTCGSQISIGSAHELLFVDIATTIEPIFANSTRLIAVHAEVHDNETALMATKLALSLSKKYRRRLHILQVSTGEEAELLRYDKPSWVTAEVTPQHLLLDVSAYEKTGTLAQVNSPLKNSRDRAALWQALLNGVIDCIATGHTSHTLKETAGKSQDYPNSPLGKPGVETALPLMLTQAKENRCTVAQVSHWMSTAVAQAYQIPNKGKIAPGYDADIVLVDLATYRPVLREELQTKCGWSPFEGWTLTGWPVVTIVGGQVVYDHGDIDSTVRGQALQFGKAE